MTISINHARQIEPLEDAWDNFLPESHHLKSRHLLALEKAQLPDIETHYLQIFEQNKIIGIAYLQLFRFNHTHLNFSTSQSAQSKLVKIFLCNPKYLLVCGNLFRINFQGFYFKEEKHNPYIFDAIKLFLHQSTKLKPKGIIIKDCNLLFTEEKCKAVKYSFFSGDVTMEISRRPHWNNFDDYLKDLSKKYLKRAKKIMQVFERVQIKELTATEILENAADIDRLYWQVINKQKVRLGIINAGYLHQLKLDLGERFELHSIYADNKMIGFFTYIFYSGEMETHYIGLDYEYNETHKTYFNILFLSVKKMIERRYEKLELGRTAKEAKANLGAVPRQIFNYVQIKNRLADITMRYFLKRFNRSENQKQLERSPLK